MSANPFTPALFTFLTDLAENNDRDWFKANKARYEEEVQEPAFAFISAFGPHLKKISPNFLAIPRSTKGSLFRIHRDTRFSKDKRPYKTHTGVHFRHAQSGDVHAPGYYLHLEPEGCFMGLGIWHPDSPSLRKIRDAIVDDPAAWKRAKNAKAFRDTFELLGDSLKNAPRGFDKEHPLVDDLKRKDFLGGCDLTEDDILADDFVDRFTERCRAGSSLMRFLCKAVDVPY
ncbi:MAG: DUF2461 domain-containing protein [Acidobacteriota bacterium]